jgi:two-component system sensor histidine kinase/response regulator
MERAIIAGKSILTIDDSRAIRVFLVQLLTGYDAELEEAGTGAEALALYDAGKRYDIVLLDLVLPDIDGFDLLKRIREIDNQTTIIMLTGVGSIKSATSAVRAGADGYVEKQHLVVGHDENELLYALQQSLEHRAGWIARQQLDSVRADFYSMVTHDLRTPAGNVAASLKVVLSGKAGELTERQRQLLDVANRSATKLISLINDYLDFSKIDAGYLRLDASPADLRDILELSVRQNRPQAAARQQVIG